LATASNVLKYISSNEIKWIDLQFIGVEGNLNRVSISSKEFGADEFTKGVGTPDLSEVYTDEDAKDLVLSPDPETFARVPWENRSIRMLCDVMHAINKERYLKDPRYIAGHTETNLKALGVTSAHLSSEVEFYVFDNVSLDRTKSGQSASHLIDSREANWTPSPFWNNEKGAYVNQPFDSISGGRGQIAETLDENYNYPVNYHSHGRAPTSQQRIGIKRKSLKTAADALVTLKSIARNSAFLTSTLCTFMPLPIPTEVGNSLTIGQSLWKKDRNVFYDAKDNYAQISQTGRYYIGGLLEHASALSVFTNPTVNSYARLKKDPYYIGWSRYSVGSVVKVPYKIENDDNGKEIKFASADPSVNPYLAYSAVVAAGIDGIKRKLDPGDPVDEKIDKMDSSEKRKHKIKSLPGSLMEAMDALQNDVNFLKGTITPDMLSDYLDAKLEEVKESGGEVHPQDISRYFNY